MKSLLDRGLGGAIQWLVNICAIFHLSESRSGWCQGSLGGQGADELPARYDPYVETRLLEPLRTKNTEAARGGTELGARRGKGSGWEFWAHTFRFGAPGGVYRLARNLMGAGPVSP